MIIDYRGKLISFYALQEDILLEVMGLAHQYEFKDLEISISDYLKSNLNNSNVCLIYDIAFTYELKSLYAKCFEYIDLHATEIMNGKEFIGISGVRIPIL